MNLQTQRHLLSIALDLFPIVSLLFCIQVRSSPPLIPIWSASLRKEYSEMDVIKQWHNVGKGERQCVPLGRSRLNAKRLSFLSNYPGDALHEPQRKMFHKRTKMKYIFYCLYFGKHSLAFFFLWKNYTYRSNGFKVDYYYCV